MKDKEKKTIEDTEITVAKIPIQDTRLFYENYTNHENLNNLIMGELEEIQKVDPKGMPGGNAGCYRTMTRYKCETELYKPISLMLSTWCDHYFANQLFVFLLTLP